MKKCLPIIISIFSILTITQAQNINLTDSVLVIDQPNDNQSFSLFSVNDNQELENVNIIDIQHNDAQTITLVESELWETQSELVIRLQAENPDKIIQPNYQYELLNYTPNDNDYPSLWGLPKIKRDSLNWNILKTRFSGATLPTIAIIDLWVDYRHPDLASQIITGASFYYKNIYYSWESIYGESIVDNDPMPVYSAIDPNNTSQTLDTSQYNIHWTHIAGIIGATINNNIWVVWTNPFVKIMPIKAGYNLNSSTSFLFTNTLALSIDYATQNNIKIINASRWLKGYDTGLATSIENFTNNWWILLTAAGNNTRDNAALYFPCNLSLTNPNVLCIGATDQSDNLASFSNQNPTYVNIWAPWVGILSTIYSGDYGNMDWTSMSTPYVAGALSVLMSFRSDLWVSDLIFALSNWADQITWLTVYIKDWKRLNLYESIKLIDNVWPVITGSINTSEYCLNNIITYTFTGTDEIWMSGDTQWSWYYNFSIITWSLGSTWIMQDRTGNENQLFISASNSLPTCLSWNIKATSNTVKTENTSLQLSANMQATYTITWNITSLITWTAQNWTINIQLTTGDWNKNIYWTMLTWWQKTITWHFTITLDTTVQPWWGWWWGWGGWGGWGWWWEASSAGETVYITGDKSQINDDKLAKAIEKYSQQEMVSIKLVDKKVSQLLPVIKLIFALPKYSTASNKLFVKSIFSDASKSNKNAEIRAASLALLEVRKW